MPQLASSKPLLSTYHHTVTSDPLCHVKTWGQWRGTLNEGESQYKEIKYCAWEDSTGIRNTYPQHRKIHTLMSDSSILTVTDSFSAADDMCGLRKGQLCQNLERWYQRLCLQGSSEETNIENRLMDMGRGEERVRYMGRVAWKLALPYVK